MISPSVVSEALRHYAEDEFDCESFGEFLNYTRIGEELEVPELGKVKIVAYNDYDYNKNYDGWSEDLWIVFEVKGILYRAEGSYTSYTGSEWSDQLTVVVPKSKTVVEYVEE